VEQGVSDGRVILQTDRLLLRELVAQDAAAVEKVLGDPVAMQYYPAAFDRNAVEEWIQRNIDRYERDGHSFWAMTFKSSGELIGDCGCPLQEVEGRNEIEIGYHVRRDLWGKGYATEAAQACMEHAFNRLGAERVISMIRPENQQSRRVAEKNGMICQKIIFWNGFDHCIYAKLKS
jgi:ribosomal-protein-alanine N-acetyltransferase